MTLRLPYKLFLLLLPALAATGCSSSAGPQPQPQTVSLARLEQDVDEGNLASAMAGINSLQITGTRDLKTLALAARIHTVTERDAALLGVVEQILAIDPANPYGLEQLGLLKLADGDLAGAETYLTLAVAMEPTRWRAWNGLGIVADADSRYDEAQTDFARALEIVPGHPKVLANLGWSLLLTDQLEDAESHLRQSLETAPDSVTTQSNLAFCLALQGRYEEAISLYESWYDKPVALNNVGYAAIMRDDIPSAKKYLSMALELKPNYYKRAANNLANID